MATIIKIKRSSSTSAPTALAQGELAYSYGTGTVGNNGDRLFIGTGTETNGEAANIDVIGGKYFTQLTDHTPGTLSATSAVLVDSNKAIDELFIGNNATTGGTLKLNEGTNNGAHFVALKAPNSVTADTTFTLPDGDGSNGQFLKTDGSGNLSFGTVVSTLSLAADTGSSDSVSTGETITFTGGTGIDTEVTDNTITFAIDNTVATLDDTQTLTNKTLTSPNVSGLNITDSSIVFEGSTADSFETTLTVTDPTADRTITLPNATDTLVGRDTTDILTNKTIDSANNTITLALEELSDVQSGGPSHNNILMYHVGFSEFRYVDTATINGNEIIETSQNFTLVEKDGSGNALVDGGIIFEGSTADSYETTLAVTDPTADRTVTIPDATTTLVGTDTTDTLTNKTLGDTDIDGSLTFYSDDGATLAGSIENNFGRLEFKNEDGTRMFYFENTQNYVQFNKPVVVDSSQYISTNSIKQLSGASGNINIESGASGSLLLGTGTTDHEITINGGEVDILHLNVDNITINANTISSTDTDGDIVLDPNGAGSVDVNNSRIVNVTDPSSAQDAATKAYVDSVANGLDVKDSVRFASTANVAGTYDNGAGTITAGSNGALSIDGQTPSTNDRVLLKDQTDATQNGLYRVTTVGDGSSAYVLTRTPDGDEASEITGGAFVFVEEGTANADNGYVFTHNGTPTLGTDDIEVAQFSGAGQISAGDALTKTGNTLDVAVDDSSIEISSDALQVKALGITNAMLAGSIDLTTKVTGTLPVTNGGTGAASLTANRLILANGTSALTALGAGTSGQVMLSNGASAPAFGDIDGGTYP